MSCLNNDGFSNYVSCFLLPMHDISILINSNMYEKIKENKVLSEYNCKDSMNLLQIREAFVKVWVL